MIKRLILIIFIFYSIFISIASADEPKTKNNEFIEIFNLEIPLKTGIISKKFKGTDKQIVILIKDTHCNFKTQKNINNILVFISTKIPFLKSFFIEGATGVIDQSLFQSIKNPAIEKEISDFLYQKSFLSGVEFFSLSAEDNYQIYGIEDIEAYQENLLYFTQNMSVFEDLSANLKNIDEALHYLSSALFSEDIIRFFEKKKQYHINHTIPLNEYAVYLRNKAITLKTEYQSKQNFNNYLELLKYENIINYPRIETATSNLITLLQTKVTKNDFAILIKNNLTYRLGKTSASEYFKYFKELLDLYKINYETNPTLNNYFKYLELNRKINFTDLNTEILDIEKELATKLLATKQQQVLAKLISEYQLVKDFLTFNSLPAELEEIKLISPIFFQLKKITMKSLLIGIYKQQKSKQLTFDHELLQKQTLKAGSFYMTALKRNNLLYENLLTNMKSLNESYPIVILGKFHIEGVSKLLEQDNISHIIIEPRLEDQDISNYIDIMLNKKNILLSAEKPSIPIEGILLAPYTNLNNNLTPDKTSNTFDEAVSYLYFMLNIIKYCTPFKTNETRQIITDQEFYFKITDFFNDFINRYSSAKKIAKKIFLNNLKNNFILEEKSCILDGDLIQFSLNHKLITLKKATNKQDRNTISGYLIESIQDRQI